MKLVVRVKLLPTPEQEAALVATLRACNAAADHAAATAFEHRTFGRRPLQELVYQDLKTTFGLSAQPALHVLRKTADAYTTLHANARNGRLGKPGSARRTKALAKPVTFRADAAQPFDDRCLSWQYVRRTVSIWTVSGRMKNLAYTGQAGQLDMLAACRKGESDLVCQGGKWFLVATCEVPEAALNTAVEDFLGVDLGIVNIATTSDGTVHAGARLNAYRRNQIRVRAELQAKGTKSAKRKLKRRAKKEARHAKNVNHVIAKDIVAVAERTGRGIALEELTGITARVRQRRPQRAALHSWSFAQLGGFVSYKAKRAGVPVVFVDPAYSSQECAQCHHTEKRNRPTRDDFICRGCGVVADADLNAAVIHAQRGKDVWGAVNRPDAAGTATASGDPSRKPGSSEPGS